MVASTNGIDDIIVRTPTDLAVEWLRAKTGNSTIESFTYTRIGTGQVSDCYRVFFTLTDAPEPPHQQQNNHQPPTTAILKVASASATSRRASTLLSLYEREVLFYNELAPAIAISDASPLAHCYHSSFHADDGSFCLLLGDAGADAVVGDDIAGATLAQARAAMAGLGRLHRVGQDERRKAEWAGKSWFRRARQIEQTQLQALYGGFVERFGERVGSREREVCERLVEVFDVVDAEERGESVVQGLVHGDYRLDNMLFAAEKGGVGEPDRGDGETNGLPLTVVDWQTVSWGPAMADVAYFLGTALTVDMRRQHGEELLQTYFDALGPEAVLSLEQCRKGVRRQAFYGIVMSIVSPMLVGRTERGDALFLGILSRHCEHVLDLGALDTLPQPQAVPVPLAPEPQDEQRHETRQEEYWQESWYFDFIDEAQGLGGYIRIGVDANRGKTWYTAMLCGPGRPTIALVNFEAPVPTGEDLAIKTPAFEARHTVVEPLRQFSISLSGTARAYEDPAVLLREEGSRGKEQEQEAGEPVHIRLNLTWHTEGVPYQYRLTTRYEIPCSVSGDVSILASSTSSSPATTQISNVPGQRDHSWGSRDWWTPRWVWNAAHLVDGTHMHGLDLLLPPGGMRLYVGYIQQQQSSSGDNDPANAGGGKIRELSKHSVSATLFDARDELPVTADIELETEREQGQLSNAETAALTLHFEAKGHGPLRLVDPASAGDIDGGNDAANGDGNPKARVALFPRAWGTVTTGDGRRGVAWMEWNRGSGGEATGAA
ncbi:aminoglycoside phosphotransferase [Phyllosticta citribraziliensis]|uniref:Aminoglycoside phosphotransferase n=1 Tax=Phyllosticta citribraziliensis TaxID=989973 RepID=A0ABR1LNY5_9PEZI